MIKKFFLLTLGLSTPLMALPNPAAVNCDEVGGEIKIVSGPSGGETGLCKIGEAVVESWTLYDAMNGQKPFAVSKFLEKRRPNPYSRDIAYPNPSYIDCTKAGGDYQDSMVTTEGVSYPLCRFKDGSAIEVWTFSAGPYAPQNQQLVELLQ